MQPNATNRQNPGARGPQGARGPMGQGGRNQQGGMRGRGRGNRPDRQPRDMEFDKKIISIRRVTRVYKGGKRMRLSVVVAVGDKKGRVGIGLGKGADVRSAEEKAVKHAKNNLTKVLIKGNTIPHEVLYKKGAAKILLKPATPGTGIIAGGPVRAVVELAGIKDVLSKTLGTNNKISNAYATLEGLGTLISRAK
jgi:small subunit ribosomal protein S5